MIFEESGAFFFLHFLSLQLKSQTDPEHTFDIVELFMSSSESRSLKANERTKIIFYILIAVNVQRSLCKRSAQL